MAEDYVRPPLVPREPLPPGFVTWRFRLVALVLLALLTYVMVKAFLHLSGVNAEDPGVEGALVRATAVLTSVRLPPR